ncbi:MAG: anhydro-N-acetylmuramic acid kinase [Hyphomicrobiaceae bacterium]|nr:anhydro-N-acetylmuramic acid kinase [Hyphomicrobiaceae bacterium]MCC0011595.1 anhydro-N-acetylmuramic acid kinase [Hyphomicrobiaceae bacterium]
MGKLKRAIGLMSGTSMDGIDVALIESDGENELRRGPSFTFPYSDAFRRRLAEAVALAKDLRDRNARPGVLKIAEQYLTDLHAEAVSQFLEDIQLDRAEIDVIGFHGHTVYHAPQTRLTVQLGDGARLARLTGIAVVYDMRAADVSAGGEGAPMAPVYHKALALKLGKRPVAFVNIGGVANVTYVGLEGDLVAFDTGPGNALLDDWMLLHSGAAYDADGETALNGTVDEALLHDALLAPFFAAPPPKSLDRDAFSLAPYSALSLTEGAATLAALTVEGVARAREHFPAEPEVWVVSGGGRKNRAIMTRLAERVENAVVPIEALGLNGDSVEAEAWAYLAVRALNGLPLSYPSTTGVTMPITGGVIAHP